MKRMTILVFLVMPNCSKSYLCAVQMGFRKIMGDLLYFKGCHPTPLLPLEVRLANQKFPLPRYLQSGATSGFQ